MGKKSRTKGKVGEREAVKLLQRLGFEEARRTQQYNGIGKGDVELFPGCKLHIEVKYGYEAPRIEEWLDQAEEECGGKPSVVLWKLKGRRRWNVTTNAFFGAVDAHAATFQGDAAIESILGRLKDGGFTVLSLG